MSSNQYKSKHASYLQLACDVIFTQMAKYKKDQKYAQIPAISGMRYGQLAVATII